MSSRRLLRSKMLLPFAVRSMSPSPKLSIDLRKPSAAKVGYRLVELGGSDRGNEMATGNFAGFNCCSSVQQHLLDVFSIKVGKRFLWKVGS